MGNHEFGRFFARKLDLYLLERRPDEWREKHLGVGLRGAPVQRGPQIGFEKMAVVDEMVGKEEKDETSGKEREEGDEIDDLFAGVERKKRKR